MRPRSEPSSWSEQFPDLFAPQHPTYAAHVDLQFSLAAPPPELVSRIHLLGRCDGGVVVCASDAPADAVLPPGHTGWRFLPGGTREPGETVEQQLDREIAEEAGARRTGPWSFFGAHHALNPGERPYRPHLPHPVAYWAYAIAEVELVGPPTNPDDGEQVTEVQVLSPAEAVAYLAEYDPIHADVVRLADAMGLLGPTSGGTAVS